MQKIALWLFVMTGTTPLLEALSWQECKMSIQEKKDATIEFLNVHKREIAIGLGAGAISSFATYRYIQHQQAPRPWITFTTTYTIKERLRHYYSNISRGFSSIAEGVKMMLTVGSIAAIAVVNELNHENFRRNIERYACGICLEQNIEGQRTSVLHCEHRFCDQCLNRMLDIALHERTTHALICPEIGCGQRMNIADIRSITHLDAQRLHRYAQIVSRERLLTMPNRRHCPTPNCNHIFINNNGRRMMMQCPDCRQQYCSNCLLNHNHLTCEQAVENNITNDPDERANHDWRQRNTRPCPQCGTPIEKNGGCNAMRCRQCNHRFLWNRIR
jgi:IBR domain, a half RING-finger domain/IBR domain